MSNHKKMPSFQCRCMGNLKKGAARIHWPLKIGTMTYDKSVNPGKKNSGLL